MVKCLNVAIFICIFSMDAALSQDRTISVINCEQEEAVRLTQALYDARNYSLYAYDVLNVHYLSSPRVQKAYQRWFGIDPDGERPKYVAQTFKNIYNHLHLSSTRNACVHDSNCTENELAYVLKNDSGYTNHFCSYIFDKDNKYEIWGVIIHELSHFNAIRGTFDHVYGENNALKLAKQKPQDAIRNADNYMFFAMDELVNMTGTEYERGKKLFP